MSSFLQNSLIIGGILAIAGLGYYLYTSDSGSKSSDSEASAHIAAESAEFLRRLNELKAIELNGEIFSDPRFISLVDYSAPILSEPIGKPNPFDINN
jgi:hypothetical protein